MKNIAIIGANRGIGLEFVKQLSGDNQVYAFCRSSNEKLDKLPVTKVITDCDVSKEKSLKAASETVDNIKFDWFIHVSGILESDSLSELDEQSIENMSKQFLINSVGPLLSVNAFRNNLKSNAKVSLLTSRMGSIEDNSSGGMYGYRMSKAALNACGKNLAHDLRGDGITCLLLHPGYVRTDMTNHNGNIDTEESVKGLIDIIENKDLSDTGTFWHTNGEKLPW